MVSLTSQWPLGTMVRGFGRLKNTKTKQQQKTKPGPRVPRSFAWAVVVCGGRLGAGNEVRG